MMIGRNRFNIYLLLSLAAAFGVGCLTLNKPDKQMSTLRVHLEANPDESSYTTSVPIYREKPVSITVDKIPFLTELDVSEAKVIDVMGGFELSIKFNKHGSWLLEGYSTGNLGKHFAVFSQFGKTAKESRWLAAPTFSRRITNGGMIFTPDATREEAERIVLGLNNVAKKAKEADKW
jgi:hypothetical protein